MAESAEKMIHKVETLTTAVINKMTELNKLGNLSEDIRRSQKANGGYTGKLCRCYKITQILKKNSDPDIFIDIVKN